MSSPLLLCIGVNTKIIKFAQFEGEYTDQKHLVDYSERRRYVELASKLLGFLVEKVELQQPGQHRLNRTR
jgi:hypothetical protein